MGSRNVRASLILLASSSFLVGCAVVDQYSGRAVVYNQQAEEAQDQEVLLNIVRAYLRRPMQFTTVTSITGTATAGGGTQYSLPTNVPFRPATNGANIAQFPPVPTFLFSGSVSGGPAFTVADLDTQEFYQGLLRPMPGQIWDLYIQNGYPKDLLFNLFVEKIVMRRQDCLRTSHEFGCEFTFDNYVPSELQLELFQALGDYLLTLGLTTEAKEPITVKFAGPTHDFNIRFVGAPPAEGPLTEAQVVAPPGGTTPAEGDVAPRTYGLCFAPLTDDYARCVGGTDSKTLCGAHKKTQTSDGAGTDSGDLQLSLPKQTCADPGKTKAFWKFTNNGGASLQEAITAGSSTARVNVSEEFDCKLIKITEDPSLNKANPAEDQMLNQRKPSLATCGIVPTRLESLALQQFEKKNVELTFYLRSVDGMIYYLGETVRRQLDPNREGEGPVFVKTQSEYGPYPQDALCPSEDCKNLFTLQQGPIPATSDFLTVNYEGQQYSIPGSKLSQGGESGMVLDIIRQQIALNSSAKSLPQSSVLSVVGQ